MARQSLISRPAMPRSATGRLRRAVRWDARLPRPLLALLFLDLCLLLPIPFLLPQIVRRAAPQAIPASAGSIAGQWPPLQPQLPAAGLPGPERQPHSAPDAAQPLPLLINPVRLQDAANADTNAVATLLAHSNPDLARVSLPVGSGLEQPLASVITGQALRWNLNPLVLLTLLDTQNGLLSGGPTSATLDLALRGPAGGLGKQITWAAIELRAGLLEPITATLALADGSAYAVPAGLDQANYALLRFLARSHTRGELATLLGDGPRSWLTLAGRIMGDPRSDPRAVAVDAPFLITPFTNPILPIARFDHRYPLVQRDGAVLGGDQDSALGYDGHNGWDYELPAGAPIRAAAGGRVLFAGWMDNDCATPAGVAVVQHANGYRTSYWHLSRVDVQPGDVVAAGAPLGLAGKTGCAAEAHLHFSVQRLGRDVDPSGWCRRDPDPWAQHPAGAPSRWLWLDQTSACALAGAVLIADDSDPASALVLGDGWQQSGAGNYGGSRWAIGGIDASAALVWRPSIPTPGRYEVFAFIPNAATDAATATYRIVHADGIAEITLAQRDHAGSWASLGTYRFLPGQAARITLSAADAPAEPLWFDAIALEEL